MITINGNKISANQSLKPNNFTTKKTNTNIAITLAGETGKDTTTYFVLNDPFVDEVTFNIGISQGGSLDVSETVSAKTFKGKNLQESVVLYEDARDEYTLSATCQIKNSRLYIIYHIAANYASMDTLNFNFTSEITVREAKMVDDLSFQDGFMKISSIIDYQEKIYLESGQKYTFMNHCIAVQRSRTGSSTGGSNGAEAIGVYKKGQVITAGSSQQVYIYIYLIFKNPED